MLLLTVYLFVSCIARFYIFSIFFTGKYVRGPQRRCEWASFNEDEIVKQFQVNVRTYGECGLLGGNVRGRVERELG